MYAGKFTQKLSKWQYLDGIDYLVALNPKSL